MSVDSPLPVLVPQLRKGRDRESEKRGEENPPTWETQTHTQTHLSPRFPLHRSPDIPAYTLIATQTPRMEKARPKDGASSAKEKEHSSSGVAPPDFTALIMTLLRLEREKTDVLITVNIPHIQGTYDEDDVDLAKGKQGKLIGDAVRHAARVWETFRVRDWGLFKEI